MDSEVVWDIAACGAPVPVDDDAAVVDVSDGGQLLVMYGLLKPVDASKAQIMRQMVFVRIGQMIWDYAAPAEPFWLYYRDVRLEG
jgi:selenophosphate synthetase-related protein